jgi:hypothetical protein
MGAAYQLENDHIFPFSRLKEIGYGKGNHLKYALAQELTNRAVLTQVANRTKSATTAEEYLAEVKAKFPKALGLQCIPEEEALWKQDRYEDFLAARRAMLADALNAFLEQLTVTEEVAAPASLEELIADGENDSLELKGSLRWDSELGQPNKKLEDAIMKCVAAFANADGGTLLIGIDDDLNVLGLENDYASLEADRDRFEVHLRNLLNEQFGVASVTQNVTITFPTVRELEICQVDVSRASEPLVIKQKDANGQSIEKFYVRSGNTSQEMPISQLKGYLKERFK